MIANYHTHTYRCGHAAGEDRQYVETAIRRGLQVLGFSDHVPMPFPDGHESRFRVPLRLLEDYVQSVLDLRAEYRADIDVRLGFEAEYYPDLFEAMLELLRPYPVDCRPWGSTWTWSWRAWRRGASPAWPIRICSSMRGRTGSIGRR